MSRCLATTLLILTVVASLAAAGVPTSRRSEEAISRVRPCLVTELSAKGLRFGNPIFIRIFKDSRELELWLENDGKFELFKKYDICAVSGTLGPQLEVGDLQAPEGFYFVTPGRMNPSKSVSLVL